MTTTTNPNVSSAPPKAWKLWTGRVLSALPVLMLLMSAGMKLSHATSFVEMWTTKLGFPEGTLTGVGVLELLCTALYVFPRTSVLGAAALSAYLGGAVVTHVRVGESFVAPVVLGLFVWMGLYLREERLAALIPLRK